MSTVRALLQVLSKLPPTYYEQVEHLYGMPKLVRPIEGNRFVDPAKDLCVHVARKFGRMGKGGLNLESAAEVVVGDVVCGKIRWWMEADTVKAEKKKVKLGKGKKKA